MIQNHSIMNKILSTFISIFFLLISCSSDDAPNEPEVITNNPVSFPTNLTTSQNIIEAGSILIINGTGFSVDETYIITFEKGLIGQIKNITSETISVEVPANAETGNILLTFKNETKVIGSINIKEVNSADRLFGYNQYPSPYISELDIENGIEISNPIELAGNNTYFDFLYFEDSNKIIATYETSASMNSQGVLIINLENNELTNFTGENGYKIIKVKSKLYGFNEFPSPYITELSFQNGNELNNKIELPKDNSYFDFIYLEGTNQIIVNYETSEPVYSQGLLKIDVNSEQIKNIVFPNEIGYKPISTKSKLFGFNDQSKPYIVELNTENGNEISEKINLPENNTYFDFVYLKNLNEIVAYYNTSQSTFKRGILRINLTSKNITTIEFPDDDYKLFSY